MNVVAYFQLKEIRFALSDEDVAAVRAEVPGVEVVQPEDEAALARAIEDAEIGRASCRERVFGRV